jgi:hypothetical protein
LKVLVLFGLPVVIELGQVVDLAVGESFGEDIRSACCGNHI